MVSQEGDRSTTGSPPLEVAQIGRRLAEKLLREQPDEAKALGGIDPEVTRLAHDLGHPRSDSTEKELDSVDAGLIPALKLPDSHEIGRQLFPRGTEPH